MILVIILNKLMSLFTFRKFACLVSNFYLFILVGSNVFIIFISIYASFRAYSTFASTSIIICLSFDLRVN